MANIIDGKKISKEIREEIAAEVAAMKAAGKTPGLAVIIVGENPASKDILTNHLLVHMVYLQSQNRKFFILTPTSYKIPKIFSLKDSCNVS